MLPAMPDSRSAIYEEEFIHVYPLFGREHVLKGMRCWCQPEPDEHEPLVIIHNVAH